MAASNLFRSAFNGLLRKSTTYKTPVVCRLSSVVLQQKYHTVKTAVKVYNNYNLQNGVRFLSVNNVIISYHLSFARSLFTLNRQELKLFAYRHTNIILSSFGNSNNLKMLLHNKCV